MADDDEDERETRPSQIPLLDDIVSEGKPVKRRRRPRREKNYKLDLDPEPPQIRDLFDDLEEIEETLDETRTNSRVPAPPEPSRELRAQADEVVDRLVKEYARDMIHRLRDELTQLLGELGESSDRGNAGTSQADDKVWDGPPLSAWDPWLPVEVAQRLEGTRAHWAVVGGWAIDLFLKAHTREHSDIEIEVPRDELPLLVPFFDDCELFSVGDGEVKRMPASDPPPPENHQVWLVERNTGKWRLDVMLVPGDTETWVYRRDDSLKLPRSEITLRRNGIPFLAPEAVLFYKAKASRDKDAEDFRRCLPHLTSDRRAWLRTSLERFHPDHAWLASL